MNNGGKENMIRRWESKLREGENEGGSEDEGWLQAKGGRKGKMKE